MRLLTIGVEADFVVVIVSDFSLKGVRVTIRKVVFRWLTPDISEQATRLDGLKRRLVISIPQTAS